VPHIAANGGLTDGFVEQTVFLEKRFAQRVEIEAAARAFLARVARHDPADALGGERLGVVFHLDEDKFSVATVRPVHVQHRVGGGAGACEGVEDDGIGRGGDLEDALNERGWLGGLKVLVRNAAPIT